MDESQHLKEILDRQLQKGRETSAVQSLLEGEISAVESYDVALKKVRDMNLVPVLEQCRKSHAQRAETLRNRIKKISETYLDSSGSWGAVARFVERGAAAIGDRVAMSVLAAGENYGFIQYEQHLKDLDAETFEVVQTELLPEQGDTLETMSLLCAFMKTHAQEKAEAEKHRKAETEAGNVEHDVKSREDGDMVVSVGDYGVSRYRL
jgi:hypothetical protein